MKVPFCRDSYRGELPINFYPAKDDEKEIIALGTPGLQVFCNLNARRLRGLFQTPNYVWAVAISGAVSKLYRIDSFGTSEELGTINSDLGPVWWAYNGTQILIVDGVTGWCYNLSTDVFAEVTDIAAIKASCLTYQDGYGIFSESFSRRFWLTNLMDFTNVDALDYFSKEGMADDIVGIISQQRELFIFGSLSGEVWRGTDDVTTTFERMDGGFIESGIAGPACLVKDDNTVFGLSNKLQFFRMNGYTPQIISTRKIEEEIFDYDRKDDVIGFSTIENGHVMIWWTFPTDRKTLVFDVATGIWHRRQSYPNYDRHRTNCYVNAFGKNLVGDYENGIIYEMSYDVFQDNGQALIAILTGNETRKEGKKFRVPDFQIEWDHGVGLEDGTDPLCMFDYSPDGGKTWASERTGSIGKIGEYKKRTIFRRNGSFFSWTPRIKISDPVKRNILSVNWL